MGCKPLRFVTNTILFEYTYIYGHVGELDGVLHTEYQ
jgi:hypothetical protein